MRQPPLARGKDGNTAGILALAAITPAYAGKSGMWLRRLSSDDDTPRFRGEKAQFVLIHGSHLR